MTAQKAIFSAGRERVPDIAFHLMSTALRVMEFLFKHSQRLERFGLQEGQVVIDYGCGPGRYVLKAAQLVGDTGAVYAVDIHPLAIQYVNRVVDRNKLTNVKSLLARGYDCPISDDSADLIYALDVFHMIEDPNAFLAELHRLLKPSGVLIIDDGHQPRSQTLRKLGASNLWSVSEERGDHLKCTPITNG